MTVWVVYHTPWSGSSVDSTWLTATEANTRRDNYNQANALWSGGQSEEHVSYHSWVTACAAEGCVAKSDHTAVIETEVGVIP